MGGFFGRLFGRDQTEQRPSRVSDQDRAILVRIHHTLRWSYKYLYVYVFIPIAIETSKRSTAQVSKEGMNTIISGRGYVIMYFNVQINTQLEREREVAKQLLRDGKKEWVKK